jgi:hypothetical protein
MPDATKRQLLYTFYLDLCKSEFVPIKHNKFTKEFFESLCGGRWRETGA